MERAVTLEQFYMGRDKAYGEEWTIQIARNGIDTVGRINAVLEIAAVEGVVPQSVHPFGYVASGWRPKAVNDKTSNAGQFSPHLYALACDLHDWLDRRLARWSLRNLDVLDKHGLYMEDPRWTPRWVHWQTRPPVSRHRVFIPSSAPALALALPEQETTA
jgi:hypothetical protein